MIPTVPKFFSEEFFFDVAEANQWRCLEESGHRLENVDQTHQVMASDKPFYKFFQSEMLSFTKEGHNTDVYGQRKSAFILKQF